MKNINENINRLRQIMSYDRSRGLLVSESQYKIEDSIEIEEQQTSDFWQREKELNQGKNEDEVQNLELAKSIAKQIYSASRGMGTDESRFLDAVKDIDSITTLRIVDNILKGTDYGNESEGFEFFVNDEFGREDVDVVESIVRHLKSIGVKSTYESSGPNFTPGTFKIETSLYPPKKGGDTVDDTSKDVDSKEPNTPEEPNNENEGCPNEEDILSGKVVLSKKSMGDSKCDVVETVQRALLKVLGKQNGGMSLGPNDFGIYGPKTVALVFAFQSLKGLKVDGIVGKNTMKSLLS